MTKRLRAGIIGLGVGEAHIEGYRAAGVEVAALCDLDAAKLGTVACSYPSVTSTYLNADDLLADPELDVVSIASYDESHCDQILKGLSNGKHLFVEKPLCLSPAEARSIREVMRRHPQQKVSSNLILRRSPRFEWLKRMIAGGEFGTVYHVEGDYLYGRLQKITDGWRGRSPGYSVTLGGGVHIVDLLLWLTGDVVTKVSAVGTQLVTQGTQVSFPDTVTALLTFKSGMTGKISTNFPCVHPHFHRLSVFGEKGTFENSVDRARWYRDRDCADYSTIDEAYRPPGKHLLLSEFVQSLQSGGRCGIEIDDVFAVLSVCFAIDEAVRSGDTVCVEYI